MRGLENVFNTLRRSETLREEFKIKTCLTDKTLDGEDVLRDFGDKHATHVSSLGFGSVSNIDSSLKMSQGYNVCLGCVVVGRDTQSKKNISLLSHQPPNALYDFPQFMQEMRGALVEINKRCEPNTIDVLLFGGSVEKTDTEDAKLWDKYYTKGITSLSRLVQRTLGREPTVIAGPRTGNTGDGIYIGDETTAVAFDTEHRRLWIVRDVPQEGTSNRSFRSRHVKKQLRDIKKDK